MADELRASPYVISLELPHPEQLLALTILDQFAFFPSISVKIRLKIWSSTPHPPGQVLIEVNIIQ
jgi:hypothetical protein